MNVVSLMAMLGCAAAGMSSLSGHVVDPEGRPVPGAQVFLEHGLGGPVEESRTSADGAFSFGNVVPGFVGVFATADGYAFGGASVQVTVAQTLSDLTIRLAPPENVRGTVTDFKNKAVSGAGITRVAILVGDQKVGIPLAKLEGLGFEMPVSDDQGRFTVPLLPSGGKVVLKVGHPQYAQEAVTDVVVGGADVRVTLYPGVLVRGKVLSRDGGLPVVNAPIQFSNARPPHDTAVTQTNARGEYAIQLKPGDYSCQAVSAAYQSPGWTRLHVSGEMPVQELKLYVAGIGQIRGQVRDAVSKRPVEGARLILYANGNKAAIVATGPTGAFEVQATEGENTVVLESAPGYLPPEQPLQGARILEGKVFELPVFWLAPIPTYKVQVLDAEMNPAEGVVVRVLRPAQFGWRTTDREGRVELKFASLPPDGTVVGMAEHVTEPLGALFALERKDAEEAKVQLLPLGGVRGRVVNGEGKGLEGVVVGGVFEGETTDALLLWRTFSQKDGAFAWECVVPQVPQQCAAYAGEDAAGLSVNFMVEASGTKDVGNLVVPGGAKGRSMHGKTLRWYEHPLCAGTLPDKEARRGKPAVVMYCTAEQAPMIVEALTVARRLLTGQDVLFALVVDGAYTVETAYPAVLAGQAPGPATTYLVGADGKVALETSGMPPLRVFQSLARDADG